MSNLPNTCTLDHLGAVGVRADTGASMHGCVGPQCVASARHGDTAVSLSMLGRFVYILGRHITVCRDACPPLLKTCSLISVYYLFLYCFYLK